MCEQIRHPDACFNLESVNRITKFAIVGSTLHTSKRIYERIKEYNSLTNWTISSAENTVYKVVEVGKPYAVPVVQSLKEPIRKIDGIICIGLDYVEAKLPATKLKLCTSSKDNKNTSSEQLLCSIAKPNLDIATDNDEISSLTVNGPLQEDTTVVKPAFETDKISSMELEVEHTQKMLDSIFELPKVKAEEILKICDQKVEECLRTSKSSDNDSGDPEIFSDETDMDSE